MRNATQTRRDTCLGSELAAYSERNFVLRLNISLIWPRLLVQPFSDFSNKFFWCVVGKHENVVRTNFDAPRTALDDFAVDTSYRSLWSILKT